MMFFNHPEVRRFLVKHGAVYTLRAKERREGRDILVYGSRFRNKRLGIGDVRLVKRTKRLTPAVIRSRVRKSGLRSSTAWIETFKVLCKGKLPSAAYLYHVRLLD